MSSQEKGSNKFTFIDEEYRPLITQSGASQFRVGDKVYLVGSDGSREGPFRVASVSEQKCTLSLENGQAAKGGEEVNMAKLEAA